MDWHKLQQTLFEIDPSDPKEDLRKLKESAGAVDAVSPTVDYVVESAIVQEGTMPIEGDYSLSDFAALAGITLTESQKTGSAGQLKGKDAIKKNPAGTTKNPTRDKLVGEDDSDSLGWRGALKRGWDNHNTLGAIGASPVDAVKKIIDPNKTNVAKSQKTSPETTTAHNKVTAKGWQGFLKQHTAQLQQIAADPKKKKQFDNFMTKMSESIEEAPKQKPIKARDPSAQYMNDLRKSGAMGAHKDKKRDAKMGKEKHKNKQYESIKDELWARLNELGKS